MKIDENTLYQIDTAFDEWTESICIEGLYEEKRTKCLELLNPLFANKYFERQVRDKAQTTYYFYVRSIIPFENGIIYLTGPIISISEESVSFNMFGMYEDVFSLTGKYRRNALKCLNYSTKEIFEEKLNYAQKYTDKFIENYQKLSI